MPPITGTTQVLGLFGYPVAHSLSPVMHARFAEATGADTVYVPFPVPPEQLEIALNALPAMGIRGVNVTVPHKEATRALLEHLEPAAQAIGAVNTVINRQGTLVGDNTDARGFLADLRARFAEAPWQAKPTVVLGAGGAARAVVYALNRTDVPRITVANRTQAKAEALAAELAPEKGGGIDLSPERLSRVIGEAGLVVNTTSLGLHGERIPGLELRGAAADAAVYDLIYNPAETPLLAEARQRGLAAANGLGMLVRQGAASFELWTGNSPEIEPVIARLQANFRE